MTQSRRDYLKTALALLAFVGLLALLGALRDFRLDFEESQKDTHCILSELNDHRQANKAADVIQIEQAGGDASKLPSPPTLPDTSEWNKACAHLFSEDYLD